MTPTMRIAVPTKGTRGMSDVVSEVFAKAPTFTFVDVVDGEVREVRVEENTALGLAQGVGPVVMKSLKDKGVEIILACEVGPGAKTLIELSSIVLVQVEPGTKVSEAVESALRESRSVQSYAD
ncbi:MAG: NifB/NifX family molybdenum-iron cluster-binding protein [Candidatus Bathyarchaeota archaeon]|nr:NifB/NifX family molybdenum-iron cluster-binding protein [Candidatus Bathyarchaeota archaeon]